MNKDLIDIFNVQYNAKGEKLITDNYTLADGTYIMVNTDGNIKYQKEFDKKVSQIIEFEEFITRDYLSKYLDSDKAVANKNIHSNNYMSFFIKKETLDLEKFLKKQKEKNEEMATDLHYTVGKTIRDAIEKLGGTMPEDLPMPDKSLKEIEEEQNIKAKQIQS